MYPLTPPPTLIVDAWAFRLADPDGNLIGKEDSIYTRDTAGNVTGLAPPPGINRVVQALPVGD